MLSLKEYVQKNEGAKATPTNLSSKSVLEKENDDAFDDQCDYDNNYDYDVYGLDYDVYSDCYFSEDELSSDGSLTSGDDLRYDNDDPQDRLSNDTAEECKSELIISAGALSIHNDNDNQIVTSDYFERLKKYHIEQLGGCEMKPWGNFWELNGIKPRRKFQRRLSNVSEAA